MDKCSCVLLAHSSCLAIFAGVVASTLPCATKAHLTVNHYSFCVFRFRPFHSFILSVRSQCPLHFFAVIFPANMGMIVLSAHFHISIKWCFTRFICVGFERTVQWQCNKEEEIFFSRFVFYFLLAFDERTIYSHFVVLEMTEFRLLFFHFVVSIRPLTFFSHL